MRLLALAGLCLAALASLLAYAAAPPLLVPYAQPARPPAAWGASAVWQARGQTWFAIRTMADLAQGTGTVQRTAFDAAQPGRPPALWDAALQLADTDPQQRQIFTRDSTVDAALATVPFEWQALPAALRQLLNADGLGEQRTRYLRGERVLEIGQPQGLFRQRAGVLGPVVRSTPLIVPPPAPGASEAQRAFALENAQREMAVYVGANDGMLHAFSASSGLELFAYIPGALHAHLASLADPGYQPRAWVDASASQRDVELAGRWRTVLASGMGMGARGLFLLDVTDPSRFGQGGGALWEFTQDDDPAIGHLHAPPVLARLPAHEQADAWAGRPVALAPSGINPLDAGGGALFVLALDKPQAQPWELDVNYFRIAAGEGSGALSAPAAVIGPDGRVQHAYAGDLQGNLWHFDLVNRQSRRVFAARDAEGAPQPIAHAPHIVHGPGGGYLVIFGTGRLIEEADLLPASFAIQSLYAIHDVPGSEAAAVRSRAELAVRTLSGGATYEITGDILDYFAPGARRGWYLDFAPGQRDGERAAGSPVSLDGVVVFQTVLPARLDITGSPASRLYLIGALHGLAIDPVAGASRDARTGALTAASVLQPLILITGAEQAGARSPTGSVTVRRTLTLFRSDAAGPDPPLEIHVRRQAGRMGWREINNWQDLRDAALRQGG